LARLEQKMGINRKKLLILLLPAVCIGLYFWLNLGKFLTLDSLKHNRDLLAALYLGHHFAFVAGFLVIYIIQTALALPGAAILSLAAGAVFGAAMGTVYAVIGATIGATISFLVARYLFHDTIQNKFGSSLARINGELEKSGFNYLLFLRLVPVFPFFLINVAAGLTKIPLRTFILGTMIGIIPGGFIYCNAGSGLASINSLGEIASPRVLGSLALLGLFMLLPVIYGRLRRKP
jgi:uncharacterized membrane protein YdjX (TVP38/TMEM64 family)